MGCTCFKGVVLGGWVWCFAHFKACSNLPFFYLLFIIHLWQMHLLRCERKYSLSCWVENGDPAVGRSLIEKRCWMWSIGTSLNATKKKSEGYHNLRNSIKRWENHKHPASMRILHLRNLWGRYIFELAAQIETRCSLSHFARKIYPSKNQPNKKHSLYRLLADSAEVVLIHTAIAWQHPSLHALLAVQGNSSRISFAAPMLNHQNQSLHFHTCIVVERPQATWWNPKLWCFNIVRTSM